MRIEIRYLRDGLLCVGSFGVKFKKSQIRMVSSWELLTIWNSSNCRRNTRPVCSCCKWDSYNYGNKRMPLWTHWSRADLILTTSVLRQRVFDWALGSKAATKSHTLILPSYAPLTIRFESNRMQRTSSSCPSRTRRQAPHSISHSLKRNDKILIK